MRQLFRLPDISIPLDFNLDRYLRTFKEAVEDGGRVIEEKRLIDGILLEGESIPATTNTVINHKLGRRIKGWVVTDQDAAATIYRVTVSGEDTAKQITLYASAAVTIDLWVF
jgi:hypothetical protein